MHDSIHKKNDTSNETEQKTIISLCPPPQVHDSNKHTQAEQTNQHTGPTHPFNILSVCCKKALHGSTWITQRKNKKQKRQQYLSPWGLGFFLPDGLPPLFPHPPIKDTSKAEKQRCEPMPPPPFHRYPALLLFLLFVFATQLPGLLDWSDHGPGCPDR